LILLAGRKEMICFSCQKQTVKRGDVGGQGLANDDEVLVRKTKDHVNATMKKDIHDYRFGFAT
jgi:hypothetical protein